MGTPVYKRILDLFEAEGINTLFGIPDPNFVHLFLEAEKRGWTVVSPHHEASAGHMAAAAGILVPRSWSQGWHARLSRPAVQSPAACCVSQFLLRQDDHQSETLSLAAPARSLAADALSFVHCHQPF